MWPETVSLLGVVVALVLGAATFINGRRSDSTGRIERLEGRTKALEDYCYTLRSALADHDWEVPPWPDELKGQQ